MEALRVAPSGQHLGCKESSHPWEQCSAVEEHLPYDKNRLLHCYNVPKRQAWNDWHWKSVQVMHRMTADWRTRLVHQSTAILNQFLPNWLSITVPSEHQQPEKQLFVVETIPHCIQGMWTLLGRCLPEDPVHIYPGKTNEIDHNTKVEHMDHSFHLTGFFRRDGKLDHNHCPEATGDMTVQHIWNGWRRGSIHRRWRCARSRTDSSLFSSDICTDPSSTAHKERSGIIEAMQDDE